MRTGGIYPHMWYIYALVVYINPHWWYGSSLYLLTFISKLQLKKMRGRVLENGSSGYGTGTNYVEEQNLGRYLIVLNYYHMC